MEHVLSKTILISQTIELIARKYKLSIGEARDRFYSSDVIRMLDDDETGLYGEPALYLLSLYENYADKYLIETDRLLLRKFSIDDADEMFINWANDSEVTKYMTWNPHESVKVTEAIINKWVEEYGNPNTYRFAIAFKKEKKLIGSIDVVDYIDGNPEIGYCLSKAYWNQGIMSEALKEFIKHLFKRGFTTLLIEADERNIGSNRVIEKCGFKFTHKERKKHCSMFKKEPVTVNWYKLEK